MRVLVSCVLLAASLACADGLEPPAAAAVATPASTGPTAPPATAAPGEGPCRLLSLAEVQRHFPGAAAGAVDRRQAQIGLETCTWNLPRGTLALMEAHGDLQTAMEDARGWTLVFLDPLKPTADRHVRFERIAGLGDDAVAVVEAQDPTKGFAQDGAYVVVNRGQRQVTVMAPLLARSPRAEALQTLKALAIAAVGRLD